MKGFWFMLVLHVYEWNILDLINDPERESKIKELQNEFVNHPNEDHHKYGIEVPLEVALAFSKITFKVYNDRMLAYRVVIE